MKQCETLFGNRTALRVLLFLQRHDQAYPTQITQGFMLPVNMVQKQLARLEQGGILVSQREKKRKVYRWNMGYAGILALRQFLARIGASDMDPADGSCLTLEERLILAESLWQEGVRLRHQQKSVTPLGLTKSFSKYSEYHEWEKGRWAA